MFLINAITTVLSPAKPNGKDEFTSNYTLIRVEIVSK